MSNSARKNEKKRKYCRFSYSEEALQDAINSIDGLSLNKASQQYKIPKGTLFNKLHEKVPIERKMGSSPVLHLKEEELIKTWIINKAKLGFPMHTSEVQNAVQSVLEKNQRKNPFVNNRPGRKWMNLFLKRHPEITLRNTQVLSKASICYRRKYSQMV